MVCEGRSQSRRVQLCLWILRPHRTDSYPFYYENENHTPTWKEEHREPPCAIWLDRQVGTRMTTCMSYLLLFSSYHLSNLHRTPLHWFSQRPSFNSLHWNCLVYLSPLVPFFSFSLIFFPVCFGFSYSDALLSHGAISYISLLCVVL